MSSKRSQKRDVVLALATASRDRRHYSPQSPAAPVPCRRRVAPTAPTGSLRCHPDDALAQLPVEEIAKAIAWVREKMTSGHTGSTPLREPFLPRLQPTSPRLAAPLRTPDWLSPSPADVETEDDGGSALGASDIGSVPTTPPAGQRTRLLSDHTAASAAPASARNVARDHAAIDGLRAQAPQHWEASPRRRRALEAAERFDERHAALSDALGRLHNKVETPSVQRQRERIIGAIQANR